MIRQFLFISALTITLALTAATWLMPTPYQNITPTETDSSQISSEFHSLKLQQEASQQPEIFKQFLVIDDTPKKIIPPVTTPITKPIKTAPMIPSVPPVTPPNFQYIGQMVDPDGVKKIFLSSDEETYVVQAGDVLSNRWKINAIQNDQITILDLTNQQFFVLYI